MPTLERIESWQGQDVLDDAGQKAGRLEQVYYDAGGQHPVLISIKHGMLGRQVELVPVAEACSAATTSDCRSAGSRSGSHRASRSRTS